MNYKTQGVCSREVSFDVKDNKITNVVFKGGCSGNTQGVARLIEGMDIDEAISRLDGIRCGMRPTSCPDQLARALKQYKSQHLSLSRPEQVIRSDRKSSFPCPSRDIM